jgi:glyoxylase-like metal-dependent hydrolase (beta-lactamase superfamily II)
LAWVAKPVTLIAGERDAVLVDTFLTVGENGGLADQVAATGKNLTHLYITHGHGDHFFGINALRQRFPSMQRWPPPRWWPACPAGSRPR